MRGEPSNTKNLIAILLALLVTAGGAFGIGIAIDSNSATVTITKEKRVEKPTPEAEPPTAVAVDTGDKDVQPDKVLDIGPKAQRVVEQVQRDPERYDFAEADELRGKDTTTVTPQIGPLATPHVPGCKTRILPNNWSSRVSTVKAFGLHYTAGLNREGFADMNGLTAFASSSAAGVSWHFLIDAEGHCYYSVPLGGKAWTIGNLNSETVNVEVIGTGRESSYPAGTPGLRKLRKVVRFVGRTYGFPIRVGGVSNCRVTKPGVITHWQGGACAGGHIDIKPYDLGRVVAKLAAPDVTITKRDRGMCRRIHAYRVRERHTARGRREQAARLKRRNDRDIACVNGKAKVKRR